MKYISPTAIEHTLRLQSIELIRRTLINTFPDATLQCFGSVGTGLYLPGGDIDLVILSSQMPSPPLKPASSLLHKLASLLLTSGLAEPKSLVVIAKARVPLVKFVTRWGGFAVDLSVNQGNGVDAAVRVRGMLEEFAHREGGYVEPGLEGGNKGKGRESDEEERDENVTHVDHGVARTLVILLKTFLNQRGMNEVFTGGLGSYSIILLVISFLQLHPKIQSSQINPSKNIGLLFVELLEYYGKHFNFDEAGISIRGRGGYFNKHNKGWFRPNQPYLLSIEDPNDPSNDVSGGSHNIIRVRQTIAGGFDSITATLLHRTSCFEEKRTRGSSAQVEAMVGDALPNADWEGRRNPLKQSILGSIIGMTASAIEAREENIKLYNDGILQRLLDESDNLPGAPGLSKKAMKRAKSKARDARKEKTKLKLEGKLEEKLTKEKKKLKKKQKLERESIGVRDRRVEEDDGWGPVNGDGEDNGGFVIDVVGTKSNASNSTLTSLASSVNGDDDSKQPEMLVLSSDDEEDSSRYSIASTSNSPRSRSPSSTPSNNKNPNRNKSKPIGPSHLSKTSTFINLVSDSDSNSDSDLMYHDSNSSEEAEEEDYDDVDVLLGGSNGDVLKGSTNTKPSAPDASTVESFMPSLQSPKKKKSQNGSTSNNATETKLKAQTNGANPKKAKRTREEDEELRQRKAAKNDFWIGKGKKESAEEEEEDGEYRDGLAAWDEWNTDDSEEEAYQRALDAEK